MSSWVRIVTVGVVLGGVVGAPTTALAQPPILPIFPEVVAASGWNGEGQLGDGSWQDRSTPVDSYKLTDVVKIAAGRYHGLAVMPDGTLRTWGNNGWGQLGYGIYVPSPYPKPVPGLASVVDAAGGVSHSLALKSDGSVWAWGDNTYGQLGDGTTVRRYSPVRVQRLTNAIALAAGGQYSLALLSDGTVWAWGLGSQGVLGSSVASSPVPVRVPGLSNVVAISAGGAHALAIVSGPDGHRDVWAWGANSVGQLGFAPPCGIQFCGLDPQRVPLPDARTSPGIQVAAIAAGGAFSVALGSDGSVWTWGATPSGYGGGAGGPGTAFAAGSGMVGIAAGTYHAFALRYDGTAFGWGSNHHGELADGTVGGFVDPVTMRLEHVRRLAAGEHFTLGIYVKEPVVCCG